MPTKNFPINKEQSLAEVSGNDRGSGGDSHLPFGKGSFDSSYIFRGLQRFTNDWSGMAQVTKIQYKAKLTSGVHTNHGSSRRVQVTRLGASFTEAGGGENSWAYGHSGTVWPGPSGTGSTSDYSLTGYGDNDWVTLDITDRYANYIPASVLNHNGVPGAAETNYGLRIWSYDESTSSRSAEFYGKDSSYEPYIVVTYTTNSAPAKPVPTNPVGTSIAAGSSPTFSWTGTDPDAGDTMASYDLQVSVSSTFSTLQYDGVGLTAGTISGFNGTNCPYAGGALTSGMTYYWRVRTKDNGGLVSPWSTLTASFTMGAVPTVSGQTPGASGLAAVWNLGALTPWSGAAAVAGPQFKFTYNHPATRSMKAYRFRIYNSAAAVQQDVTVTLSAAPGTVITHNCTFAVVNGTQMKWGVEVQDVDGNWSAAMALLDFKVRWGQAVFAHNVGVGANNLSFDPGILGGTGAQVSFAFQTATADTGAGGSAWVAEVNSLAPTAAAYIRVLVRLAATVSGQNPALADMQLLYAGTASVPDKWVVTNPGGGNTLTLDKSQRRFGYYSAKMTAGAVASFYIYPWRRVNTDGVLVAQDTDYTYSIYVKTNGSLGAGAVQLMVRDGIAGTPYARYPNAVGTTYITQNSASFPDGWQRLVMSFHVPPGVTTVWPNVWFNPTAIGQSIWVDGGKLEEGKVTSLWTPGFLGEAITLDALGLSVDAKAGGILRLRGSTGGVRDTVDLGPHGLVFGGDAEVSSPSASVLEVGANELRTRHTHRIVNAADTFGALWFIDGTQTYFLLTDSGDPRGAINGLRPFTINLTTGQVSIQNGLVLGAASRLQPQLIGGGGSAFPGSPTVNDRYWRTDLSMEFFWNGTRWLSTTLFAHEARINEPTSGRIQPYTATATNAMRMGLPYYSVWLERITTSYFISSGGTALSASHKWDLAWLLEPSTTAIVTQSIASGASSTWLQLNTTVGLVIPATDFEATFNLTMTGTPGNLRAYPILYYRRIAT